MRQAHSHTGKLARTWINGAPGCGTAQASTRVRAPALKQCLTAEKKGCLCWEPPTELFEDGCLLKFPQVFFTPFVNWWALNSQLCWWCLGGLCVLALQSSLFLYLFAFSVNLAKSLASKNYQGCWVPYFNQSGQECQLLMTYLALSTWGYSSCVYHVFPLQSSQVFWMLKILKFWFPSSNPRDLMVFFCKTGFSPADLGLIHLLCPFSNCCWTCLRSKSISDVFLHFVWG